ncbi:aldolase/citrate lyase family protein [Rhodococcus jostii]|nr:aldolase/citrate lyase family protein [Rhodococcus jostii]
MPLSSTAVPLDVCRSWLLTSATDPVRLRSAALSGTDALILDIEDGVPPHRKEHARDIASQWLQHERAWVRISDATTPYWEQDLHTLRNAPGLQGIMLAKAESDEQIKRTARLLDSDTPIVALIESAAGIAASGDSPSASETSAAIPGSDAHPLRCPTPGPSSFSQAGQEGSPVPSMDRPFPRRTSNSAAIPSLLSKWE